MITCQHCAGLHEKLGELVESLRIENEEARQAARNEASEISRLLNATDLHFYDIRRSLGLSPADSTVSTIIDFFDQLAQRLQAEKTVTLTWPDDPSPGGF